MCGVEGVDETAELDEFKGRHLTGEVVFWAVGWYCRYGVSYRDFEQIMADHGVRVNHATIYLMGSDLRPGDGKAFALAMAPACLRQLAGR